MAKRFDHRLSAQVCGQCHSYQSQSQAQKTDWNKNGPRFLADSRLTRWQQYCQALLSANEFMYIR